MYNGDEALLGVGGGGGREYRANPNKRLTDRPTSTSLIPPDGERRCYKEGWDVRASGEAEASDG